MVSPGVRRVILPGWGSEESESESDMEGEEGGRLRLRDIGALGCGGRIEIGMFVRDFLDLHNTFSPLIFQSISLDTLNISTVSLFCYRI